MSTRTEKIKVLALGALAAVVWHLASTRHGPAPRTSSPCPVPVPINERGTSATHFGRGKSVSEFRPVFPSRLEDAVPTALDLTALARLQYVESAWRRDLFRFATAPHVTKVPLTTPQSTREQKIVFTEPVQLAQEEDPLVFYGYALRRGSSPSAFVLKDDEIYITREGELVQSRFRVIAVSLESVTVEDGLTGDRKKVSILQP